MSDQPQVTHWECPRCGKIASRLHTCTPHPDVARLDYMLRLYEAELGERLTRADLDRLMQIEKEEADA